MDAVPALGEHTDAVLQEMGVDAADIARLRAAGAI
jgi:crotonobetainyl-CoA:carnitine CoA-transferase CaiB-like acyl-CoA transferase